MRASAFSIVIAAAVISGCGPKPAAQSSATASSGNPLYLALKSHVTLSDVRTPLGRKLKIQAVPNGDLYVLDTDNQRILRYSGNGTLIQQAGGLGSGPLQFDNPVDFDCDGLGIWILDRQNQRIVRLDLALHYVEELSLSPDEQDPTSPIWYDAIAVASSGEIILLDKAEPKAVRISPAGDPIVSYGGFGLGAGRMNHPTALATAPAGDLFVADGSQLLDYDRTGNFKKAYRAPGAITALTAGSDMTWLATNTGAIFGLAHGKLSPVVVDAAAGELDPVALDITRKESLVVLDRESTVWLLGPAAR